MWNVEVVSQETIKPSIPTPNHKSKFKLSYFDQVYPNGFSTRIILFYSPNTTHSTSRKLFRLKKSLSDLMVQFYPLAGRVENDHVVNCNDAGVDFLVARVEHELFDALRCDDAEAYEALLPPRKDAFLSVQANVFACGGLGIGVVASHKVFDGWSLANVINFWAGTAAGTRMGGDELYEAWKEFPPSTTFDGGSGGDVSFRGSATVTKRFIINSSAISSLREKSNANRSHPTRNEAVMALLWHCMARSLSSSLENTAGCVPLNVRTRMTTQSPPESCSLGNLVVLPTTSPMKLAFSGDEAAVRIELEEKLRQAIKSVDGEYITKLLDKEKGFSLWIDNIVKVTSMNSSPEVELISLTSWFNFPLYEVDFGWGKPELVALAKGTVKNVALLMGTKNGDGMEAWITMEKEDMVKLENDPYFLSYVSKLK